MHRNDPDPKSQRRTPAGAGEICNTNPTAAECNTNPGVSDSKVTTLRLGAEGAVHVEALRQHYLHHSAGMELEDMPTLRRAKISTGAIIRHALAELVKREKQTNPEWERTEDAAFAATWSRYGELLREELEAGDHPDDLPGALRHSFAILTDPETRPRLLARVRAEQREEADREFQAFLASVSIPSRAPTP